MAITKADLEREIVRIQDSYEKRLDELRKQLLVEQNSNVFLRETDERMRKTISNLLTYFERKTVAPDWLEIIFLIGRLDGTSNYTRLIASLKDSEYELSKLKNPDKDI